MDIVGIILDGLRIVFGFLLVLFLPGFSLSLIYFPRSKDLRIIERLVYSTVLSIGSVMVLGPVHGIYPRGQYHAPEHHPVYLPVVRTRPHCLVD